MLPELTVILTDVFVPKSSLVKYILVKSNEEPVENVTTGSVVHDAVGVNVFCKLAVNDAVAGVIVPSTAFMNVNCGASSVTKGGATESTPSIAVYQMKLLRQMRPLVHSSLGSGYRLHMPVEY